MTERVARIKVQRESVFGASRRQVIRGENHSRAARVNEVIRADGFRVREARIVWCVISGGIFRFYAKRIFYFVKIISQLLLTAASYKAVAIIRKKPFAVLRFKNKIKKYRQIQL